MARFTNPFRERKSEQTTSDQEFVRLFSPKILDRLPEPAFANGVHLFMSPPGAGKTTLFRAFTPTALRSFWGNSKVPGIQESAKTLLDRGVLDPKEGPQMLGVALSCSSGYADLPPGASLQDEGLFRALFDCRVVLRTLRSLSAFVGVSGPEALSDVVLEYPGDAADLKVVPREKSASRLAAWAEQCEKDVYSQLDAVAGGDTAKMPAHVRFEGILWLNSVRFVQKGRPIAPRRLLMVDDLQSLRRKQRDLLCKEFIDLRVNSPIWLAQRTEVLGEEILVQGGREGRDIHVYALDELWSAGGGRAFVTFAQNVLHRRLEGQDILPKVPFEQYLKTQIRDAAVRERLEKGIEKFRELAAKYRGEAQYAEWLARADSESAIPTVEALQALYTTSILIARNEGKRQIALVPLAAEELDDRDSSALRAAAEIFTHEELGLPYYFGIDRLCAMATSNVEELLGLTAVLYDALEAMQMLRRPEIALQAEEQEKLLVQAARSKKEFIPRIHEHGTKSLSLLEGIGSFCRERTFVPNAPIAPGVTGIRLSDAEMDQLMQGKGGPAEAVSSLRRVLAECVANNLLVAKESSATTGREGGTTFYLNRMLCACYGLPLQYGGWQDVSVGALLEWMHRGRALARKKDLTAA